jgi:hypothetical protein
MNTNEEYMTCAKNESINEEFIKYWKNERRATDINREIMVQRDRVNPDGSITHMYYHQSNFISTKSDLIDGHFWLEDMNGKIISDGGLSSYQHRLPCFQNGFNPDFVVLQPVRCPIMEKKIIDDQVARIKNDWGWGGDDDLFKATARQMWEEKEQRLKIGFLCLQYSICEHLYRTEKGEKCRIRFGCAGVVNVIRDEVFWFYGHLEQTKIDEWINENVDPDAEHERQVFTHDRIMRIREVPNAIKMMRKMLKERDTQQQGINDIKEAVRLSQQAVINDIKEAVRLENLKEAQKIADKALEELLAEEDLVKVKVRPVAPKKKNKKNKNKTGKK